MTLPTALHAQLFGDLDALACLSDEARIQTMLDVEAALAQAEATAGVIPRTAVTPIRQAARAALYDRDRLAADAARAGNIVIPLVAQLTQHVAAIDRDAARYVHWGITSQDVLDTALVLQLRSGAVVLLDRLERACAAASMHARAHRLTPIAGRTWLQQATPTTFGLKAAGWLDALERNWQAVNDSVSEAVVLQCGGASGTLAALGPAALDVAAALAAELGLALPPAPWHAHRDRLARVACALGVAAGTLGKVARDIALLAQTEVAEAWLGAEAGGSSTMPHKRNPVAAAVAIAAAIRLPGLVASILAAMPQEHERGLGGWPAEWDVMPEIVALTAGAARACGDALETLTVDPARMRDNLAMTGGLPQAEAVVMMLAERLGKSEAHAIVEGACRRAADDRRPLADVLAEDPRVAAVMPLESIQRCLSPESYLGAAPAFVDRVLAAWDRTGKPDA